ncbi:MAG: permease-like cell division protein FtsX [Candidatus Jorgensenbacteria bacterium]|nr:permease-like cell division protein FtsX [Candidatus Jorgensenbacteria bacterium]
MVTLSRIIKYGLQAIWRNGLLSASTISVMILAALVFEGLIIFNVVGKSAVQSIQDKIDISVYFKSNTPEDTILGIKRSLEGLNEVKSAEYISREQALEDFKAKHATDDAIKQALDELTSNPLLASLNVKAKDPHEYSTIADYLQNPSLKDNTEKITYAQNQTVIERLIALVDTLKGAGILLTIFFAFLAVMVSFNTIRLAIFSNSEQLSIMRLVGASNKFIQGPYIVEGCFYGFISAVISFVILIPIVGFLSPYLHSFIPELDLAVYFRNSYVLLFFYQLLFCIIVGILSSSIAIRRYLKT